MKVFDEYKEMAEKTTQMSYKIQYDIEKYVLKKFTYDDVYVSVWTDEIRVLVTGECLRLLTQIEMEELVDEFGLTLSSYEIIHRDEDNIVEITYVFE